MTSVLVGASKPEQIFDDIKTIDGVGFLEEGIRKIDEITVDSL